MRYWHQRCTVTIVSKKFKTGTITKNNKEKSVIYTNRQGENDITFLNLDQVLLYKKKSWHTVIIFFRIFENCKITFNILSNLVRLI